MAKDTSNSTRRLDPTEPLPPEAAEFARKLHGMLNGEPKDEAAVRKTMEGMEGMFDLIAAGLYSLASMLVGEGEDSIRLVEAAVRNAEVSACTDPEQARIGSRRALAIAALDLVAERNPGSLAVPEELDHVATCIEEDDLSAAGVSREELGRLLADPGRGQFRIWLESLPTVMRTVFVLRGVAAFSANESAALLAAHGGAGASGWSSAAVREAFRQALCSLASQMIQAGASHRE
jgi:DNA-directed RNA polymerase specialized sigma24 family protein